MSVTDAALNDRMRRWIECLLFVPRFGTGTEGINGKLEATATGCLMIRMQDGGDRGE